MSIDAIKNPAEIEKQYLTPINTLDCNNISQEDLNQTNHNKETSIDKTFVNTKNSVFEKILQFFRSISHSKNHDEKAGQKLVSPDQSTKSCENKSTDPTFSLVQKYYQNYHCGSDQQDEYDGFILVHTVEIMQEIRESKDPHQLQDDQILLQRELDASDKYDWYYEYNLD